MQISETQFKKLPDSLKNLFKKLPNPGSDEVVGLFPQSTSTGTAGTGKSGTYGAFERKETGQTVGFGDKGSAARFFYCAKASKRDRDEGLESFDRVAAGMCGNTSGKHITRGDDGYTVAPRANNHPTVKPTDLMRYLCRLVTPPGGMVLDPFMGSGSTGKAAVLEGFGFIGIEREAEYAAIAEARIAHAAGEAKQHGLFEDVA